MIVTTAEDSYNIFRPNLEPEDEDEVIGDTHVKNTNVFVDSDEEEEERFVKTAKKLNKDRKSKEGKRRRME